MEKNIMVPNLPEESDRYYFYSSSFDPIYLIKKNAVENQSAVPNYFKNAFGVLIKPEYFPTILNGKEGTVEEIPIPSNWHADIAEFGAAFRAIELSGQSFSMVELGCGWGCWMNITGVIAKRKGKQVHLYGVEGDKGHVQFAIDALTVNGFNSSEYMLYHGIASAKSGVAFFPIQAQPGISWGEKPVFNMLETDADQLVNSGKYLKLPQIPLCEIDEKLSRIDLLHIDIQGGELDLITNAIDYISNIAAYLLIGTHSRYIEGELFDLLTNAGWILEIERPAILGIQNQVNVLVDGVQGWRNPKLLPDETSCAVNTQGKIEVINFPSIVKTNTNIVIPTIIYNDSTTYWGEGRYPIRISYHWLNEKEEIIVSDGERTLLGRNGNGIVPGGCLNVGVNIKTPPQTGKFILQLTLVQDGMAWFEERGFFPTVCNIEVEQ